MSDGVLVRPARDDELAVAGELVAQAYLTQPNMADAEDYLAVVRDARSRVSETEVLVAVDSAGEVLGSVRFVTDHLSRWAEVERPGEAGFRMLGVAPGARGRGVGEALVMACVQRARAAGRRAVAISTESDWATARRLYERLGFERDPERDFDPVPGVHLLAYVLHL
jgi:ribosomal protein S18 acetylase RimI-like enzyme